MKVKTLLATLLMALVLLTPLAPPSCDNGTGSHFHSPLATPTVVTSP